MRHGDKCCVAVATGGKDGGSEMRVKTIDVCVLSILYMVLSPVQTKSSANFQ